MKEYSEVTVIITKMMRKLSYSGGLTSRNNLMEKIIGRDRLIRIVRSWKLCEGGSVSGGGSAGLELCVVGSSVEEESIGGSSYVGVELCGESVISGDDSGTSGELKGSGVVCEG